MTLGSLVRRGVPALVLLGSVACARQGVPPGGPPDFTPPAVIRVTPEPFSTIESGRDPVVVRFSERISERIRSGAPETAVEISPVTGDTRVKFGRDQIEISVQGGFQPGLVYRVRVLPVINDMFGNQMREPFELVFSTGADLEPSVIAGTVENRLTLEPLPDVKVIAVPDTGSSGLIHVASADQEGIFALRYVPTGSYLVTAFQDVNRNLEVDPFESRDSVPMQLTVGDTVLLSFRTLVPDTTPAVLLRAELEDTLELRLGFDDFIDPELDLSGLDITLVDSVGTQGEPPAIGVILHDHELAAFRMARVDSIVRVRREEAAADSTTGEEEEVPPPEPERAQAGAEAGREGGPPEREPREPLPSQDLIVIFHDPPTPGTEWWVRVRGLENITGLGGGGGDRSFSVPMPDTTLVADSVPTDSVPAPDTATVGPDTTGIPPDTSGVPPDTTPASGRRPSAVRLP